MSVHLRTGPLQAIPIESVLTSTDSSAIIIMEFGAPFTGRRPSTPPPTTSKYVTYHTDTDEEISPHLSQITSAITNTKHPGQHCEAQQINSRYIGCR